MARTALFSVCLVLLAGSAWAQGLEPIAPLFPTAAPAPPGPGGAAPYGNVPTGLANLDITALAPAMSVMPVLTLDSTMKFLELLPLINVTWVMEVLPYLKGLNTTGLGEYAKPLVPLLSEVKPSVFGYYLKLLNGIDVKALTALVPSVFKLNPTNVGRLVPAINAFDPKTMSKLAELLTKLTPETYDALIDVVNLGVPAINVLAEKMSLLPSISLPEPQPFVETPEAAAAPAPAPAATNSWTSHFGFKPLPFFG
ncbi:hypothetical protein Rsub_03312 [Raphidocelis subcapitata]|uniref:Uncharacterized protein n=1 Tax=Raphidocelis subcapitata TaxID=307507 RepID=A0A2V0NS77_9CHLO|nr:hypothetical protein Rsub_03312 [Raphidocelis subcapitata]|eukprot:GBF90179.1 hypothetical protein Rsub_03312 [Raphidocelis subcapitata]